MVLWFFIKNEQMIQPFNILFISYFYDKKIKTEQLNRWQNINKTFLNFSESNLMRKKSCLR
ncbi:MAG TPA: hypothetical protein DEF07_06895 [Nitrosomonas sp.]|nr:hypothetical protein [Nitrosomonas sp.]